MSICQQLWERHGALLLSPPFEVLNLYGASKRIVVGAAGRRKKEEGRQMAPTHSLCPTLPLSSLSSVKLRARAVAHVASCREGPKVARARSFGDIVVVRIHLRPHHGVCHSAAPAKATKGSWAREVKRRRREGGREGGRPHREMGFPKAKR